MRSSPIMRGCFNFLHIMKLCLKLFSYMFIVSGIKPFRPSSAPLAVFTCSGFFIIFTLSDILVKSLYKMHEQVAAISN